MRSLPVLFGVVLLLLGGVKPGYAAGDPCGAPTPLFSMRSQVPRAAFATRNKAACGIRAIGSSGAAVQWTQLRLYLHANGQAPVLLPQSGAGFTASLNAQNLGTVGVTYTNTGTTTMNNVRLVAFADLDIDRNTNGFANEFGSMVSLAPPPGAPAGAIAASAWEIDEPGFLFGNILANAAAGALDNFNAVPNSAPDDVSFGLQFPIGTLAAGQLFTTQLQLDSSNIGGLQQVDPASNRTVYLNGFAAKAALAPPPDTHHHTPEIPSPAALPLLVAGLGTVYAFRRSLFGKQ